MRSISTGGSTDTDSSFNVSSDDFGYSPETLYQRLRAQVAPSSNVLLGDKLLEHASTDTGKIHLNDSVGCTPSSPRSGGSPYDGLYSITHKGLSKPKVPVRTSSFNAMNDAKAAGLVSTVPTSPSLKVHDYPPSGYRPGAPSVQSPSSKVTFCSPDVSSHTVHRMALIPDNRSSFGTNCFNTQPLNNVAPKNTTINSPKHPPHNLPPLSCSALAAQHLGQRGRYHDPGSPTSISEDDNTTTSGSYIVDTWEMPRVIHALQLPVSSNPAPPVQQALV